MKTIYFITGTSAGIGKSLVEELLKNNYNFVYGFSRSEVYIENKNYKHQQVDLSKQKNLINFKFPKVEDFDKIILINNAGLLAPINYIGSQKNQEIVDLFTVNLIAPSILSNTFLNTFKSEKYQKIILNVGSGAANYPYDGWSTYCSSKSGLHMLTNTLKEELKKEERKNSYAFCILPGVIDTNMQTLIRSQKSKNFSHKDKFVNLYKSKQLTTPYQTALGILKIIDNPEEYETIFDLRNLQ